jgi:hypothetical protein
MAPFHYRPTNKDDVRRRAQAHVKPDRLPARPPVQADHLPWASWSSVASTPLPLRPGRPDVRVWTAGCSRDMDMPQSSIGTGRGPVRGA